MNELQIVGESVARVDGRAKVTGKAIYSTDFKLPGMLFGKVLRSPYPNARVVNIDTSLATHLPGVKAVVTGKDFMFTYGNAIQDQPYYCWDKVRYVGDPLVGVAAVDEDTAEEALSLIRVDYEELPAVLDVVQAMESGCPLVHPNMMEYRRASGVIPVPQTNICAHVKIRKGDIERGLRESDYIFEDAFSTPAVQHCHLEPHVSIAQVDPSGRITIWTSSQRPYDVRRGIAVSLGIPVNKVRIIVLEVGGGFGGKVWLKSEALSVALAMKVKQGWPVKVTLTREEEFSATSGVKHPSLIKVKTGTSRDGRIVARKVELVFDTGAYADAGPWVARYGAIASAGPYVTPHVWTDSYAVYTNKMVSTAWRSLGTSQTMFAIESQMDIIANNLGIDPIEFRLKNILHDGSLTVTGQELRNIGIRDCLLKVKEVLEWESTDKREARGKGVALTQHFAILPGSSSAVVEINEDGTASILSSTVDLGQGSETVISQIAAQTLGMRLEDIRVTRCDTDVTPYDIGVSSSRATFYMGNAVQLASLDAKEQLIRVASEKLEANPEDLEIREGWIWIRGSQDKKIAIQNLPLGRGEGSPIIGRGSFQTENPMPMDVENGHSPNPISFWMFAAQGVEAQVDRETGKVKILRVVSAHDVGKAINPVNCQQQIEGAIGMGIGISLMEEIKTQNGKVMNPNFVDYKMPTAMDMPGMMPVLVEVPQDNGPYGARGLGEPAVAPTSAATANAIFNAVGVRIQNLPLTPDKVLNALKMLERER